MGTIRWRRFTKYKKFVKKIGHDELRVYKGGATPGETESEAAHYLAEMAENMPGSWKFWLRVP